MTLKSERLDTTLLLTVDRPEAKNAIDRSLCDALCKGIELANDDHSIHCLVIAATGRDVFIAGGDLKELATLPMDARGAQQVLDFGPAMAMLEQCDVPVIAAVQGDVLGGGCELLLMCDLVVMEQQASLRFAHVMMGLCPAWGASTRLAERIGRTRAAELLLTGRALPATKAYDWGLITEVVESAQARSRALAIAERIGRTARPVLNRLKRSLNAAEASDRPERFAKQAALFTDAWGKPPHQAALQRFVRRSEKP